MKLKVDFEIINPETNEVTPANMTLDNPPIAPMVGDLIPTESACFRVVQRAYIPERSRIEIGKMQLCVVCTLMPVTYDSEVENAE